MTTVAVIAITLISLTVSGFFASNMFLFKVIDEINRERPEDNLISYFGNWPGKTIDILYEYHRLYPEGKLHIYSLLGFAVAVVSLVVLFGGSMLLGYILD